MTPNPRDPRDCFKTCDLFETDQKLDFGLPWNFSFHGSSRMEPEGTPRTPRCSKGYPKAAWRHPNKGQRWYQRTTKGAQRRAGGIQRNPLAPKGKFKGSLYTQKLPINRTSVSVHIGLPILHYGLMVLWYYIVLYRIIFYYIVLWYYGIVVLYDINITAAGAVDREFLCI